MFVLAKLQEESIDVEEGKIRRGRTWEGGIRSRRLMNLAERSGLMVGDIGMMESERSDVDARKRGMYLSTIQERRMKHAAKTQ